MAPLQRVRTNKGFALFEGLICLNVFLLLSTGALLLTYLLVVQIWLHAELHEALLCLKREEPAFACKDEVIKNSKSIMRFARLVHFQVIENSDDETSAEIIWAIEDQRFRVRRFILWNKTLRKRAFSL